MIVSTQQTKACNDKRQSFFFCGNDNKKNRLNSRNIVRNYSLTSYDSFPLQVLINHKKLKRMKLWQTKKLRCKTVIELLTRIAVLPVHCLNFHSIELRAGKLSIWCQHLLYLKRFDSSERKGAQRRRRE